jgi:TPR repeat protein
LKGDYQAAKAPLHEAGRAGNLRAVWFLRVIAERGLDGRPPNPDEAQRYVYLLAVRRERLSQLALGSPHGDRPVYLASLALVDLLRPAPGANLATALARASTAANQGFVPAMNLAAAIAFSPAPAGAASSRWRANPQTAYEWCHRAAQAGDPLGLANLGWLTRRGLGVTADPLRAASLARQAAAAPQTTPRAFNDLGSFYEEGQAVTRDLAEAARWYGLAAARGYQPAADNLARLKAGGGGAPTIFEGLEY